MNSPGSTISAYERPFRGTEKDLLGLRDLTEKAAQEILALTENPYKGHPLKGSLNGVRALEFSLKGVAYRAAYVGKTSGSAWCSWLAPMRDFTKRRSAGQRL